jgi:hypothetical protein
VTTRCGWDALPAPPHARFVNLHACGDIGDGLVTCVETVSTPVKRKRFGRAPEAERIVMAVTANYLVWASGSGDQQAIAAARLRDIEATEYDSSLVEDTGLDVVGLRLGATERESWFLPLDQGADGQGFREDLRRVTDGA